MRVKAVSVLVVLFLCLSLLPVLAPPLAGPVNADPMDTLTMTWTMTSAEPNNWRPHNLQTGDEVIQFGRPNLAVGTNPTGGIATLMRVDGTVSGDFSGSASAEWNALDVWWNELGSGVGKGYVVGKATFDDSHGNTATMIMVGDCDFTSPSMGIVNASFYGYGVCASGTGIFSGQMLIGTMSGTSRTVNGVLVSHTGTMHFRRYSASEISSEPFVANTTWTLGNGRALGPSSGPQSNDEFLQVTRPNISIPAGEPVGYNEGLSGTGTGTVGSHSGTIIQSINNVTIPGTSPEWQGWIVGKQTLTSPDGALSGVFVMDTLGLNTSFNIENAGYGFMLMENATGAWAGRDYYMIGSGETMNPGGPSGTSSLTGTLYYLTPSVGVATSTGTGLTYMAPNYGSIQNLIAVPESSMPDEGKPDIDFPHGFFEFEITGLANGQSVTLAITLPSAIPTTAQYWKYGPTPSDPSPHWYVIPMGDNDGDNIITITLVDGGLGDDDLTANGTIVDQGGPGWPPIPSGGGRGVPAFPSTYIGIGAALGAGALAYLLRRRLIQKA